MLKFRLYVDKDAETKWLNDMAKKGYAFKKYCLGFYTFEPCKEGEYIYQVDLLNNWNGDKEEFASFMEDSGVEVVDQWYRWVILRKKAVEGPFEMYSDPETKLEQYNRIRRFFLAGIIVELGCLMIELNASFRTGEGIFWGATILIGIFVVTFARMLWKYSMIIGKLKKETY